MYSFTFLWKCFKVNFKKILFIDLQQHNLASLTEQKSYRQIFNSISLFGGVQIIQILISIIRAKMVAILIGPAGLGINTLLQSGLNLIKSLTNMGLSNSAIREVAISNNDENKESLTRTIIVLKRWMWITGGFGFILTIAMSKYLSVFAFENSEYTSAFMLLAITLLFWQLSAGQLVVLQGLRKLTYLALSTIIGSILGLIISFILYYYYHEDGIIAAIIITSCSSLILTWYYSSKVSTQKLFISWRETWIRGSNMLRIGFLLSLSGIVSNVSAYFLQIFINRAGGLDQVGLYNAGFTILNSYVGMIFTAMATDYFPRLTSVVSDRYKINLEVSRQAEIAILMLGPLVTIFILFAPVGVDLLYTKEFHPIVPFLSYASIGILLKAYSWSIGFIFLATGSSKLFFVNEFIASLYMLAINIIGYYLAELTGLGISFTVTYLLYLIQVVFVSKKYFGFNFSKKSLDILFIQLSFVTTLLAVLKIYDGYFQILIGVVISFLCLVFSIYQLYRNMKYSKNYDTF